MQNHRVIYPTLRRCILHIAELCWPRGLDKWDQNTNTETFNCSFCEQGRSTPPIFDSLSL